MASVTVTGVTDTTASIEITGLDIYYFQKRLTFYCGEIAYSVWDTATFTVPESGKYSYTYTGLSPNTSYIFAVYIEEMRSGIYEYEAEVDGSFSTSGGGGGGGSPHFNAYDTGSNIYVYAYDLQGVSYDYIYYSIASTSHSESHVVNSGPYTFENVPSGTYTVEALYVYNNVSHRIYTPGGSSYVTVTVSGGGGGNGYVYIYTGSAWVRAKPYIYTGSAWVPTTPYIYTGSTWKPTT